MKHVKPPLAGQPLGASPKRPAAEERKRQKALRDLAKLRKEASAEINRLIAFLDASDSYVTTELEVQIDDSPIDDTELEPSLGFLERQPSIWGDGRDFTGGQGESLICAGLGSDREDEHDGREPEDEGGEAVHEDDEPSLGWPENMAQGSGLWGSSSDRELAAEPDLKVARRREGSRKPGVHVERGVVRSRLVGLTSSQERAIARRRNGKGR